MSAREAKQLVDYIRNVTGFESYTQIDGEYGHVGATLTDAVLQSSKNYERNVWHRIARIRRIYVGETNLHNLNLLLQQISAQEYLDWKGTRKPRTFFDLVALFGREAWVTEDDLRL